MPAPLYTIELLRLATVAAAYPPLAAPAGFAEGRATPCGSRIAIGITTAGGRIDAVGLSVTACAFAQAAAALVAQGAMGRSADDLTAAAAAVRDWLAGGPKPAWPNMAALAGALPHSARHGAIRLAFDVAADAAARATQGRAA